MMNEPNAYIYILIDPETGTPHYVGRTINPDARLDAHCRDFAGNSAKQKWIAELKDKGTRPKMEILEENVEKDMWNSRERHWIVHGLQEGWPLTNVLKPSRVRKDKTSRLAYVNFPLRGGVIQQMEKIAELTGIQIGTRGWRTRVLDFAMMFTLATMRTGCVITGTNHYGRTPCVTEEKVSED